MNWRKIANEQRFYAKILDRSYPLSLWDLLYSAGNCLPRSRKKPTSLTLLEKSRLLRILITNLSMKPFALILALFIISCSQAKHDPPKNSAAQTHKVDTVTREPQVVRFNKTKKNTFLDAGAVRVVSYSFLDVHDYEMDSSDCGQLLSIMPNYDQYLSKKDRHPKIVLTRSQTQKLLSIINNPESYSNTAAFCDYPRNCFCFYNSKNEIIGWYEVCFECARIASIPEFKLCRKGGLNDRGLNKLKKFCTSANITVGKL